MYRINPTRKLHSISMIVPRLNMIAIIVVCCCRFRCCCCRLQFSIYVGYAFYAHIASVCSIVLDFKCYIISALK